MGVMWFFIIAYGPLLLCWGLQKVFEAAGKFIKRKSAAFKEIKAMRMFYHAQMKRLGRQRRILARRSCRVFLKALLKG